MIPSVDCSATRSHLLHPCMFACKWHQRCCFLPQRIEVKAALNSVKKSQKTTKQPTCQLPYSQNPNTSGPNSEISVSSNMFQRDVSWLLLIRSLLLSLAVIRAAETTSRTWWVFPLLLQGVCVNTSTWNQRTSWHLGYHNSVLMNTDNYHPLTILQLWVL